MEQGDAAAGPQSHTSLQSVQAEADGVIHIMKENVSRMLEGQQKAHDLLEKAENMEQEAGRFKDTSKEVRSFYRSKNVKLIVAIVVVVLIIVLIIVLLATGVIPVSAPLPPTASPTSKP